MSVCGVILVRIFPHSDWIQRVPLRIQSESGKMRTRITPNTDTFHAVYVWSDFFIRVNLNHIPVYISMADQYLSISQKWKTVAWFLSYKVLCSKLYLFLRQILEILHCSSKANEGMRKKKLFSEKSVLKKLSRERPYDGLVFK